MPDIGPFHPIFVHFVIGFLVAGVVFRVVSLTGKLKFTGPAAATLLLLGAGAAIIAVEAGEQAEERSEGIPGVRQAVSEHQEWGERTRNLFLLVGALELAALALRGSNHRRKILTASAVAGVVGLAILVETGERGGDLVYSYAAGVGTRTGNDEDVGRLLVAGLYGEVVVERRAGRPEEAARLVDELVRQRPQDSAVQLLKIRSLIEDERDGRAALEAIARLPADPTDRRAEYRRGIATADAYGLLGLQDSVRAVLQGMERRFQKDRRIQERLKKLEQ